MPTHLSLCRPVVAALAATLTLLPGAVAQVVFDVAPYAGYYLPRGAMLRPAPPSQGISDPYAYNGFVPSVAQRNAFALGGHATAWLAPRLGLEGTLSYAPSGVIWWCRVSGCDGGHVITGSAKVVVSPIVVNALHAFHIGVGVGFDNHGGEAYHGVGGGTRVAPTVGAGIAVKVGASRLLRIDAEEYWFRPHLHQQGDCNHSNSVCVALLDSPTIAGFERDVILSIGLVFRTGRTKARALPLVAKP